MQYCAMQYCSVRYCAMQYCAMQYSQGIQGKIAEDTSRDAACHHIVAQIPALHHGGRGAEGKMAGGLRSYGYSDTA